MCELKEQFLEDLLIYQKVFNITQAYLHQCDLYAGVQRYIPYTI